MTRYKPFLVPLFLIALSGAVFAQGTPAARKEVSFKKEELALGDRPSLDKGADVEAQPAVKKIFLNITAPRPKFNKLIARTTFRPEVGLINTVISAEGRMGHVLSLKECIDIATKNSLQLQIGQKNITLAKMKLFEARRNMLPSATIVYQDYKGRVSGKAYVGRKQYIEGQQVAFDGGELLYTMKQAEKNAEIVQSEYQKVKNELMLQVKKAYYTLAKAKENLKMQQDLAREVDRIFDMISQQLDAGVVSRLEFMNVSSQASQIKYQLASAQGDETVAELILNQAMNIDMSQKIDTETLPEFKKVSIDFETALRAAFVNRPDVKINSFMLDYYRYGKNVAKAKGWPKITLMGNWGLAKEEFASQDRDLVPPDTDPDQKMEQQWYAGIKGSMPFWGSTGEYSWTREQWTPVVSTLQGTEALTSTVRFNILDKLSYYSDKQSAVVDFDRARQELNKMKQDITLEIREACFNYEKAALQLDTAVNKVKYQEGDLALVKLKRSMDDALDSNVIESMIKTAQEKFGYTQALADCHTSLASIDKAIGVEDYFKD